MTEGFEAFPVMPGERQIFKAYHSMGKKRIRYIPGMTLPKEIQLFIDSVYGEYGFADEEALAGYIRHSTPYQNARSREPMLISREDMCAFYGPMQDTTC